MSDRPFTDKIHIKVTELLVDGTKIIKYYDVDPDFFETIEPTEEKPLFLLKTRVKHIGEFKNEKKK